MRYIELREIDRRRGLWQAFYAGDKWTPEFITTVGQRWLVEDGLYRHETCCGLPWIVMGGVYAERAA